ncbi:MAG: ureidoglycolate lyase [Aliivibrio sp.]|uniref:ureidoglycolate lyase n=1 Tax=Aliivibrio sp. TaxID=1872443 RepID=UPI001A485800|nr:ureidoglycolate lyase [Aliivibrio sp.]
MQRQIDKIILTVEPLTAQAFSLFGDVIERDGSDFFLINNGSTRRYHELANVDVEDQSGKAIISIFEATPLEYPLTIKMVERHPLGSQAFIPLLGNSYLIVVAQKGENPKSKNLKAFISNGKQGVNYHKGVWHHPILALTEHDQYLIVDRAGTGNNCEEHYFDDNDVVVLNRP